MTPLKLDIPFKNPLITPREKSIRNLYYYGEFLALLNFDGDGWNELIHPQLLQYIQEFSKSYTRTGVSIIQTQTQDTIEIILSSEKAVPENISTIFEVSKELQTKFFCTPVIQHVKPDFSNHEYPLPLERAAPGEFDISLPRFQVQKHIASISSIQHSIDNITYALEQIGRSRDATITGIEINRDILQQKIDQATKVLPEIIAEQYLVLSQFPVDTPTKLTIANSSVINDTPANQETVPAITDAPEFIAMQKQLDDILDAVTPKKQTTTKNKRKTPTRNKKITTPEPCPKEEKKNQEFINSQSLSTGDLEVINTFLSDYVEGTQELLQKNTHQNNSSLSELLNARNLHNKQLVFRGTTLHVDILFDKIIGRGKNNKKIQYDFIIKTPFPWVDITDINKTKNKNYKGENIIKTVTLSSSFFIETNTSDSTDIQNLFKEVSIYETSLRGFVGDNYTFPLVYDDPDRREPPNDFFITDGLTKLLKQKKGTYDCTPERDIENIKEFFDKYNQCNALLKSIDPHYRKIIDRLGVDSFSSIQAYINFLEISEMFAEQHNWERIIRYSETQLPLVIQKKKTKKDNEVTCIGNGFYAHYSRHRVIEYIDTNFGIVFGEKEEEQDPKWSIWGKHYKISRAIQYLSIIQKDIIPLCMEKYTIKQISRKEDSGNYWSHITFQRDTFEFTPVAPGKKYKGKFYVHFTGEIQWDAKKKNFYPHMCPIVVPASPLTEETESEIQQIHIDIQEAFDTYIRSLAGTEII